MSLWNSKQTWITLICIGAGLFMLAALAHVTQATECGDLSKYLPAGQKCSTSDGWDPMAQLDNMGTPQAEQSQVAPGHNWAKTSRQYRWNQTDLGSDSSGSEEANSPQAARAASAGISTSVQLPANESVSEPVNHPVSQTVSEPANDLELKRSRGFYAMTAPLSNVSNYDVILDVSDGVSKFIPGAVHIDYLDFQNNSTLRPALELAKILGNAGISRNNSVLIYGECKPCGGGPAVSTYAYWVLSYLGHDPTKIRVLDGGIANWAEADHPVVNETQTRPKADYTFEQKPELLATYEQVKNGGFQLVDARSLQEFGAESIPGSINIPYDNIMTNGRIKDEAKLKVLFSGIRKDKPVVVYTTTGVKASLVWFALEIMGYDARLSTWQELAKA
jgi:thiosulfate/3-mercaptopyruvate sulfurtransferase